MQEGHHCMVSRNWRPREKLVASKARGSVSSSVSPKGSWLQEPECNTPHRMACPHSLQDARKPALPNTEARDISESTSSPVSGSRHEPSALTPVSTFAKHLCLHVEHLHELTRRASRRSGHQLPRIHMLNCGNNSAQESTLRTCQTRQGQTRGPHVQITR